MNVVRVSISFSLAYVSSTLPLLNWSLVMLVPLPTTSVFLAQSIQIKTQSSKFCSEPTSFLKYSLITPSLNNNRVSVYVSLILMFNVFMSCLQSPFVSPTHIMDSLCILQNYKQNVLQIVNAQWMCKEYKNTCMT